MMGLAVQIELTNMVAVKRPHDAYPGEHRRAAERRHQDQSFHSRLPSRGLVLGLRKPGDIGCGILERDELAIIRAAGSDRRISATNLASSLGPPAPE
jgi:hypothetical protein